MDSVQKHAFAPFGGGTRVCLGIHLAYMELRHGIAEFVLRCSDIELSDLTTPESMEMENYFLVSPISKRCMIRTRMAGSVS
jgi:cytochrome P450